jgi:hypothetical protein
MDLIGMSTAECGAERSLSGLKPQACSPLGLSLQRICSGARISAHPNKSAVGSASSAPHSGAHSAPERQGHLPPTLRGTEP